MTPEDVLRALGRERVLAALADDLRDAHPDHGGDPAVAEARLMHLRGLREAARQFFTIPADRPKNPCTRCGGSGRVVGTFGATSCLACGGTGEQS